MSTTPLPVSAGVQGRTGGQHGRLWAQLTRTVGSAVTRRLIRRIERRAMADLRALDDRMLRDIGQSRPEMSHAARYHRNARLIHDQAAGDCGARY